jgi:hypothetical protein
MTAQGGDVLGAALLALASLFSVLALRGEHGPQGAPPVLARPPLAFDAHARASETCNPRPRAEMARSVKAPAADTPVFQ